MFKETSFKMSYVIFKIAKEVMINVNLLWLFIDLKTNNNEKKDTKIHPIKFNHKQLIIGSKP